MLTHSSLQPQSWLSCNVRRKMNAYLRVFAVLLSITLCGGCVAPAFRGTFQNPASAYIADIVQPVSLLGVSAGLFWIQEKKWPESMAQLEALPGTDYKWKATLAQFSEVTFHSRPDGALEIKGAMPAPQFGGKTVTAKPISFAAVVSMQPAPGTTAGWRPQVEVDTTDKKEPNKAPEPTQPSVTSRANARLAPAARVAHL
jgi:hypothetical protein